MIRLQKWWACGLVLTLLLSGCYGPFQLTRKLHQWNGEVGDKWANEGVFLVFIWVPIYGLATLGDALVFNSIQFWTGKNPIDSAQSNEGSTHLSKGGVGAAYH